MIPRRVEEAVRKHLQVDCGHQRDGTSSYVHVLTNQVWICNMCLRQRYEKLYEVINDALLLTDLEAKEREMRELQTRRFLQWTIFFQQALTRSDASNEDMAASIADAAMKIWDLRRPADE